MAGGFCLALVKLYAACQVIALAIVVTGRIGERGRNISGISATALYSKEQPRLSGEGSCANEHHENR